MDPIKVRQLVEEFFLALAGMSEEGTATPESGYAEEGDALAERLLDGITVEPLPEPPEPMHLHEEEPTVIDVRLSKRQQKFCSLVAGGETKAAAYQQAYTMTNHLASAADCAARALLRQQKIRDRIDEVRADLGTAEAVADRFDEVRAGGARGGWCFQLTPNQERFCRARALGGSTVNSFKASGYAIQNYSEQAMAKAAEAMLQLPKVRQRIAALEAGDAPEITTIDVGRRPRKQKVEEVVVEVSEPAEEEDTMPPRIAEALERYAESRLEPGSFLRAALENDLGQAILAADPASLEALPAILNHIANRLRPSSHGSPEKVAAWLGSERDARGAWRDDLLHKAPVSALRAYLDAERDVGEARGGGTD